MLRGLVKGTYPKVSVGVDVLDKYKFTKGRGIELSNESFFKYDECRNVCITPYKVLLTLYVENSMKDNGSTHRIISELQRE